MSVLEEERFVVLEQYFSLCVVNGEIQKVGCLLSLPIFVFSINL